MTTSPRDITRVLLTVLALGGLILLSYRVVQPFVGAGVWAATIVGFVIAGVPMAVLLGAIGFLLCLIQIGTVPLLAIGAIWLFATGHAGAGVFLLAWTMFIAVIDQAVRPYLMKLGIELPLPLVVAGVIGGLSTFGLVGIFVGPVTLAVAATLLDTWLHDMPQPPAAPAASPGDGATGQDIAAQPR